MTNICEICGCENPATRMYEKEGEVFRMICEYHEKQVNEKKLDPEFKCWEKEQVYFNKQNPNQNLRRKFSSMTPQQSKSIEAERELKDSKNF